MVSFWNYTIILYPRFNVCIAFIGIHEKSLEELHARYEHKKQLLLDELKHNFRWMRDIFSRDDERLDLMSIIFEARNDDDTQQTHINFEDSIAVLNNEVGIYNIVPMSICFV